MANQPAGFFIHSYPEHREIGKDNLPEHKWLRIIHWIQAIIGYNLKKQVILITSWLACQFAVIEEVNFIDRDSIIEPRTTCHLGLSSPHKNRNFHVSSVVQVFIELHNKISF